MKRIRIRVSDAVSEAELFEDQAPQTVNALWDTLPIRDRTIQVRWSGDAWRTEGDYELLPKGTPVENVAERLSAGDIIYFPSTQTPNMKIGIAYGSAQWLAPFMEPVDVAHIGKMDTNLDEFVARCQRIIFEGPLEVEISKIE